MNAVRVNKGVLYVHSLYAEPDDDDGTFVTTTLAELGREGTILLSLFIDMHGVNTITCMQQC